MGSKSQIFPICFLKSKIRVYCTRTVFLNLFCYAEPIQCKKKSQGTPKLKMCFKSQITCLFVFISNFKQISKNLTEPQEGGHGTLGFRGTLVENHCTRICGFSCINVNFKFQIWCSLPEKE